MKNEKRGVWSSNAALISHFRTPGQLLWKDSEFVGHIAPNSAITEGSCYTIQQALCLKCTEGFRQMADGNSQDF